jgi:hypothetical protein
VPEAFKIGPFLLPTVPVAVIAALWLAIGLSGWLARRSGLDRRRVERVAEGAALMGLVGVRLAFALLNWDAYRDVPWTVLFFWQPGYLPGAGLALGAAYLAWRLWRTAANQRLAQLRALGSGYALAGPDYGICDVGTTIYVIQDGRWRPWDSWYEEIAPDWRAHTREDLQELLDDIECLQLQEAEKQNVFKLSYYVPSDTERDSLFNQLHQRLDAEGIRASLIWSIDEAADTGLLDILPECATKLHAIRFVIKRMGFHPERAVFAGDSGNDLPALTSGLQAVLVKNALRHLLEAHGLGERLFRAVGEHLQGQGPSKYKARCERL